jgi:prephenate dehydrogenase
MIVTVIGVGLIGGSLALALKDTGFAARVIGLDNSTANLNKALELGIIDDIGTYDQSLEQSDLVIVAIPVNHTTKTLTAILDKIGKNTIVTDMGSTKQAICEVVENHPNRRNFVASHPIAGTEHSGPTAAFKELFKGKIAIICDREKSSDFALQVVEDLYNNINMKLINMESHEHDLHVAYVSHLSHISSFALGITVLEKEKDEATIFNLAGSGFESTVRLAKSSPEMWNPIFEQNARNVSDALGEYIRKLQIFKSYIDNNDVEKSFELMKNANEIRRVLDGINGIK